MQVSSANLCSVMTYWFYCLFASLCIIVIQGWLFIPEASANTLCFLWCYSIDAYSLWRLALFLYISNFIGGSLQSFLWIKDLSLAYVGVHLSFLSRQWYLLTKYTRYQLTSATVIWLFVFTYNAAEGFNVLVTEQNCDAFHMYTVHWECLNVIYGPYAFHHLEWPRFECSRCT